MKKVNQNTLIQLYYKADSLTTGQSVIFNVWDDEDNQLVINQVATEIPGNKGVYYIDFLTPSSDTYIIIKANLSSGLNPKGFVLICGDPSNLKLFYAQDSFFSGQTIAYEIYTIAGIIYSSSNLTDENNGFYSADVSSFINGTYFFKVYPHVVKFVIPFDFGIIDNNICNVINVFPSSYIHNLPVDFFLTFSLGNAVQLTPYSEIVSLVGSGVSGSPGISGISGFSGSPGISGYSGEIGISGYSGISGLIGAPGIPGASGFSGFSGFSGESGYSGYSGYSGVTGYSGYSGRSGYSGYSGYSGRTGYSGISGSSGYSGTRSQDYRYNSVTSGSTSAGVYTTLKSYTLPANTLSINGNFIEVEALGEFTIPGAGSNFVRLRIASNNLAILTNSLGGTWRFILKIFRINNTSQYYDIFWEFGDSATSFTGYFDVNFGNLALTLSSSQLIDIQGATTIAGSTVTCNVFTVRHVNAVSLS